MSSFDEPHYMYLFSLKNGRKKLAYGQSPEDALDILSVRLSEEEMAEIVRLIEQDGWYLVATKGSHRQYKHPTKSGRVTIAGHPNDDLAPGTLNSILKQAQLEKPKGK
jgi:predicted RNA binding protein YcfA (HicA-like mRNA interferase family)